LGEKSIREERVWSHDTPLIFYVSFYMFVERLGFTCVLRTR